MKPLILKQDLLAAFRKLGMQPGMTVMVHTSLSSMGYVCGGAPTVIEALLETVGSEGTGKAEVTKVDGKKIEFKVAAYSGERLRVGDGTSGMTLLGEGTHLRFIVDREKFMSKLQ